MNPRRWVVLALLVAVLPAAAAERSITLKVTKQRLSEVVRQISEQAGVPVRVAAHAQKEIPTLDVEGSLEKVLGVVARLAGLTVRREGRGYVLEPEAKPADPPPLSELISNPAADVIASVKPRVALVIAYLSAEQARAQGTAFVAGTDGLLVTNAHVVKGAAAIQVVFADGTAYYAVIAAMDEDKDLAVLRVPARFPEPLRLGDSDELREGDDVALTGYPLALELLRNGIPLYASTAKATVNAVRPGRSLVHQQSMLYIQIDAPINPGNSGAPLYRLDSGVVVGVVQSKLAYEYVQDTGVGFAIPINAVRRLLAEARANTISPPTTPPVPLTASNVPLALPPPLAEGDSAGGAEATSAKPPLTRPFDLLRITQVPPIPEPAPVPGVIALHAPGGKMAVDPQRPRLYAVDYGGNSVVIIDTDAGKVVRRLFTGSKPYGVAIGAEGRFLYVANSGGSEISVIDLDALTPLGCIPLSFRPFDLLLGPAGRLYTTPSGAARSSVRAIDLHREMEVALGGTPVLGDTLLAASPTAGKIFLAERGENATALLQCEGVGKLAPVDADASLIGTRIQDLLLSPDGKRLYVASDSLTYVSVLDAETLRPLGQLEVGQPPAAVALSADGQTAYVCHRAPRIDRFDTRTFLRTGTLSLPAASLRCAVSPDGKKLFAQLATGIVIRGTDAFGPPTPE
jgi:serine protease Do